MKSIKWLFYNQRNLWKSKPVSFLQNSWWEILIHGQHLINPFYMNTYIYICSFIRNKEISWTMAGLWGSARDTFWCSLTIYYRNFTFYPRFMECLIQKHFSMFESLLPVPLAFCPVSIKATFLLSSGFFLSLWCSFSLLSACSVHSFPSGFFSSWYLKVDSTTTASRPLAWSNPASPSRHSDKNQEGQGDCKCWSKSHTSILESDLSEPLATFPFSQLEVK